MSAEPAREFVDANVLVYAFDASAGGKHDTARRLLDRLWASATGVVSIQILQEFFVTVTRKVPRPLAIGEAADRVRELAAWRVFAPTIDDVMGAIDIHKQARIGFWDAMVVRAAAESGCEMLWTEDLADGRRFQGVLIRNPFADG
jgi:predicted nucleic acid-binding protein